MPMPPRERLMVTRSKWLQTEERLRRWDDSVVSKPTDFSISYYTNTKKHITTPAYVTMPFLAHPAPTTDPCMDS